jgi:hypothetical protein
MVLPFQEGRSSAELRKSANASVGCSQAAASYRQTSIAAPPPRSAGVSSQTAAIAIAEVLDSIGDTCPEGPLAD